MFLCHVIELTFLLKTVVLFFHKHEAFGQKKLKTTKSNVEKRQPISNTWKISNTLTFMVMTFFEQNVKDFGDYFKADFTIQQVYLFPNWWAKSFEILEI